MTIRWGAFACGAAGGALLNGVVLLSSCVTVYSRDPDTITSFRQAIDAREADWVRVERALAVPTPTARDINGMRLLNDAELDRLRASLFREEQK